MEREGFFVVKVDARKLAGDGVDNKAETEVRVYNLRKMDLKPCYWMNEF